MYTFRLTKDGKMVGWMELQPKCCKTSERLIWRYSKDNKKWGGGGRDVIDFDNAHFIHY